MKKYSKKWLEKEWYGAGKPKSHEKFLEELLLNNKGYRDGEFKVIGRFKGSKTKIYLKDKYGYCAVIPYDLLTGVTQKMSVKSAVFKTAYVKEYLNQNIKQFKSREYRVISEYTIGKNKLDVLDRFGNLHAITYLSLKKGKLPSFKSAVHKNDFVFNKICRRNVFFKSGEIKYLNYFIQNQKMLLNVEDKFGLYVMDSSVAYAGSKPTIEVAFDKNQNLRNRLAENGGDYDYSQAIYEKMRNKVDIICRKHGLFRQNPANHVRGEGCPKCGGESTARKLESNPTGWTHTNWKKWGEVSTNFDSYKVYIVKLECKEGIEKFFKIGRTYSTVNKRLSHISKRYKWEVIHVIEAESAKDIANKEVELLRQNAEYRYTPLKLFGGSRECFSKVVFDDIILTL